jgi:hypothetical protein
MDCVNMAPAPLFSTWQDHDYQVALGQGRIATVLGHATLNVMERVQVRKLGVLAMTLFAKFTTIQSREMSMWEDGRSPWSLLGRTGLCHAITFHGAGSRSWGGDSFRSII